MFMILSEVLSGDTPKPRIAFACLCLVFDQEGRIDFSGTNLLFFYGFIGQIHTSKYEYGGPYFISFQRFF